MRHVRLFEKFALFVAQFDVQRGDGFRQMVRLARADDWRGDAGLVQHPRERDLRRLDAALAREFRDAVHDFEIFVAIV